MFVHLHVHSPFSFQDGASRIPDLVGKAAELGMDAMAITDHNNLSATVRFIKAAKRFGIKPIIGCELTMEDASHLTVLCRDNRGYRNLCAILTEAHLGNERKEPKVSLDTLRKYPEGLIVLTGCRRGLIPSLILRRNFDQARRVIETFEDIWGKESVVVELSETALPGSSGLNKALSELAKSRGLRAVATNNVHYVSKEDFPIHDILTCIRTLTRLEDVHPERRLNAENYLKSQDEMYREFGEYREAVSMTSEIAGECGSPLELGESTFPAFDFPREYGSAREFLRHLVSEGAISRYGRITEKIRSRLDHELYVIEKLGYEDYFLVVWDLVRFAQNAGIRHAGRGSAADSAVAFCLGITDVDPIAQNLLFERFMSLERGEKPDIDVDFDARRRDEVSAYVYKKYGHNHVAAVATYNTFQGRSAIRDVGKVMGYSPEEVDSIAKRLPYMRSIPVSQAFSMLPEFKGLAIPEKKVKALLQAAERIVDLPRFLSTHLGGLVISRNPVNWLSPIERSAKGVTIVQFDKDDVEDLGLVKIDLLSLRTLGAVEDSLGYLKEGALVDYDKIPLDDERTYARLRTGDTVGVFQLESPAQRALQSRLNADNIEDIVASVALIRPGPIKGDMVEPFIKRRQGLEPVTYLDPRLEPILKKTYGVILFQEQVIEIATTIAGFTPGEADGLRRVMTHMRSGEEMNKIGKLFIRKATERGVSEETAEAIFQCIKGYASYGFCEAHARAFGTTAYKTAYLIEHYPAEFFAAILNNEPMGFYPLSTVCVEARRHGVAVLGPSVNHSCKDVVVKDGQIRLPLKFINGMAKRDMETLVSERERAGPYTSFRDFDRRTRFDLPTVRALILCGAFDEFGVSRKRLLWALSDRSRDLAPEWQSESLVTEPDMVRTPPDGVDFSLAEKIRFEYEILGMGVSGHPMEVCRRGLDQKGFVRSDDVPRLKPGEFVKVGGIPVRPHRPPTRSGKTVVFLSLEDEKGLIDVTCFENVYERYGKYLFPGRLIPLGVWGEVQKRGNAYSITARTVFPLAYALH
ncbi:MAG TPA: DNA polymerase III subunit alpha [Firmicutes bacterium]|nr:DNA polymerase III subunit alpha [Candidatus Fermentithermobacillaceae bacterium]